jgi:ABC-type phosphate transport system substrate-binding protein
LRRIIATTAVVLKASFLAPLVFAFLASGNPSTGAGAGLPIVFIVNKQNPANTVNVRDVIDYYEKRKRQWPDGAPVRFIDRNPGSPEREAFLHGVLKQSESDIDLFWFAQRLRSGNSIPIQVSTDALVIELVKTFRGAIGYISPSIRLANEQVKVIQVTEIPGG